MDILMPFLLLCASGAVGTLGEPLGAALRRRSEILGVYASEFTRQYEPVAYVAVPLHAPLPVLHILSPSPPAPRKRPARPQRGTNPSYAPPINDHPVYAASTTYAWRAVPSRTLQAQRTRESASSSTYSRPNSFNSQNADPEDLYDWPKAHSPQDTYERPNRYRTRDVAPVVYGQPNINAQVAVPTMLYQPNMGEDTSPKVLYARPDSYGGFTYSSRPKRKRTEPIIIRVHKYRTVKDR